MSSYFYQMIFLLKWLIISASGVKLMIAENSNIIRNMSYLGVELVSQISSDILKNTICSLFW